MLWRVRLACINHPCCGVRRSTWGVYHELSVCCASPCVQCAVLRLSVRGYKSMIHFWCFGWRHLQSIAQACPNCPESIHAAAATRAREGSRKQHVRDRCERTAQRQHARESLAAASLPAKVFADSQVRTTPPPRALLLLMSRPVALVLVPPSFLNKITHLQN